MLNVILTSYNRPVLVRRAIESLINQTSDQWHLIIRDDGSDEAAWGVIVEYLEHDNIVAEYEVVENREAHPARCCMLINDELNDLDTGIVGYMCDNAEYQPELVETVLEWFDKHPEHFAGYVRHKRDVWMRHGLDGVERIGAASQWGHWDLLPPLVRPLTHPAGLVDHSQVFHRLPTDLRWDETEPRHIWDGLFFTEIVKKHGPIQPIQPIDGAPLVLEHLLK